MKLEKMAGLFLSVLLIFTFACEKDKEPTKPEIVQKSASIAVLSDLHYYDPTLGTSSDAFEEYLAHDRKLIKESEAIMEAVVDLISDENVEIVLVPGDLTKDGVKQCHENVAQYLAMLEGAGKKVYVVPGNHDIGNTDSYSYPDNSDPVLESSITADEFSSIYNDFGFSEAIYKDASSLSYIAEPKDGIWILGIDGCNYNSKYPEISWVGGKLTTETLNWISEKMQFAKENDITVFTFAHHGVVEHFPEMDMLFADYLFVDWENVAAQLANMGINLVFTGHHHATDINNLPVDDTYIIDIQTGSTVTWQCPYRLVNYDGENNLVTINTKVITSINYDLGGQDFQTYAKDYLDNGMQDLIVTELGKMGIPAGIAGLLVPNIAPTLMAYYHGDEPNMQSEYQDVITRINQMTTNSDELIAGLGAILLGVWNDTTPDNNVIIDLNTGTISYNSGS